MRWILITSFILSSYSLNAQEKKTWIGDTSIVQYNTHEGDTFFYVKRKFLPGEWRIFYDSNFKQPAYWINSETYDYADTSWFRSGRVKSWKTPNDSCWNCWYLKEWHAQGSLKSEMYYLADTCYELHYYPSGTLAQKNISYRDSAHDKHVTWHYHVEFYENGQMKALPLNPNSWETQREVKFFESGKKMSEVTIIQGALVGEYLAWHENGQINVRGKYTELRTSKLGMPTAYLTGTWSFYDEAGNLIKEQFFEEGNLVKTIEY